MRSVTADELITYLSWVIFLLIFIVVSAQAIRRPSRAHADIALLFGTVTLVILVAVAGQAGLLPAAPAGLVAGAGILALPYLLLRLTDDLAVVPLGLRRVVEAGLVLAVAALWLTPAERPLWLNGLLLLYIVGVLAYVIGISLRATLSSRGVTRRRLVAMTAGSLFLVFNIAVGSLGLWLPQLASLWRVIADVLGLAAGVAYLIGFAPPRWLRRAWQEPELRAFLGRAATLPRLPTTGAIVAALEHGAATSVGIARASIGLWDEAASTLVFGHGEQRVVLAPDDEVPAARAFRLQQPIFSPSTRYAPATYARLSASGAARAVLAAPITAGGRRLGVLVAYAPRAPVFADDDLALIALLADQAAVILESRALIDEATRVQALEQATRLKEDFLSAAAHDLKTPLTTIITRAQLMRRRAQRDPVAPADLGSIESLLREGQRLKRLVLDLLDATRVEQGRLVGPRELMDLAIMAREVCVRHATDQHPCAVEAPGPVVSFYDPQRIEQLLDNLVENAIKYSPDGGPIQLAVRHDAAGVHMSVTDQGIGIPPDDLPQLFARFHRGTNVDDRRFPGMGLGLFICHGIVEQHGGELTVESRLGYGSTFHVRLPFVPSEAVTYAA